jgi:hypothetical protein
MGDLIGDKHEHGFQRQNANYSLSKMNYIDQCSARSGPLIHYIYYFIGVARHLPCVWAVRYSAWYHRCNKLAIRFLPSAHMYIWTFLMYMCTCNRRMQFCSSARHRFINRRTTWRQEITLLGVHHALNYSDRHIGSRLHAELHRLR